MKQIRISAGRGGFRLLTLLAAGALALGGCATEPARYNAGAVKARTFNFVRMSESPNTSDADKQAQLHALIQNAIEKNLASKGLTKVDKDGDVAVLYMILISDGTSTKTINDYYGYDESSNALQDEAHKAFAIDKRNKTAYDAGTLVIDIVDLPQGKVLWRNFVWRPILKDLPTEQREVRLQEAVDEVFKNLRVAQ